MRTCLTAVVCAVSVAVALAAPSSSAQAQSALTLRVQHPDGKPAAGAQAVVFGGDQSVYVRDASFMSAPQVKPITANEEGVVQVSGLEDQQRLVVVHDAGFALLSGREMEALAKGIVMLRPYGRIEGRLMIGGSPAPEGSMVSFQLYPEDQQLMQILGVDNHATTDAEGRFTLEHVWPGAGLLTHLKVVEQGGAHTVLNLISVPTKVAANETTRAQIGGSGRPVVGKIVLPERARGWTVFASLHRQTKLPEPPWPEEAASWTEEQKNEFQYKWLASAEGLAAVNAMTQEGLRPQPGWMFEVDKEGRLSANDVEPGEYQLLISAIEPAPLGRESISQHRSVVVPKSEPASPREPHDLGEIDL